MPSHAKTLDFEHTKRIRSICEKQKRLQSLKGKLLKVDKRIALTQEKSQHAHEHATLVFEKERIHNEIKTIDGDTEMQNYFLDLGPIIFQYYENKERVSSGETVVKKTNTQTKSVVDFFNSSAATHTTHDDISDDVTHDTRIENTQQNGTKFTSRQDLLTVYMSKLNEEVAILSEPSLSEVNMSTCMTCGREVTESYSESVSECTHCGTISDIMVDVEKPWYKELSRENHSYSYKRSNHFNEWIAQFQAKETTYIPQIVISKIILELKKSRITDLSTLNVKKLREILRKLSLSKYYEHAPHIICQLNGVPPPVMSRDTEEKLRSMFRDIQAPFLKHCPKDRSNFLSYSFTLHKFVELLGLDEFKPCFPLLKSREKLAIMDSIWKKICAELNWKFIKSL